MAEKSTQTNTSGLIFINIDDSDKDIPLGGMPTIVIYGGRRPGKCKILDDLIKSMITEEVEDD